MTAASSIARKLTVIVFLAVVLAPVVLIGFDGPWLGREGIAVRQRTDFPRRISPGAFQTIDKWFADRLGLRYPLIYLGTELHLTAFGRPLDRHIYFGRDGWMFWTEDADRVPSAMADSRGVLRFTSAQIKTIEANLLATRERFAACSIPFFVAVAPNKQGVYPEHVLDASSPLPRRRFDDLLERLGPAARSTIVDLRETMLPAKARHAPLTLYNKTETHWNELGAFHAYVRLMQALRLDRPELASLSQYDVAAQRYAGGDMATFILFAPWRFPDEDVRLAPRAEKPLAGEERIDPRLFRSRNPDGQGKLLLIGDSFTAGVVRYLQRHFAEIVRNVSVTVDGALVARERPDAVLVLIVERNLENLLWPQVNAAQTCAR